jgi:hypothetical protein
VQAATVQSFKNRGRSWQSRLMGRATLPGRPAHKAEPRCRRWCELLAMEPSDLKRVLLLVPCMIALQSVASAEILFRPVPPFQPSEKTCLTVHRDGAAAYWLNHCSYAVTVRWTDDAKCLDWSCQDEVPANARSTAAISGHVRWCECRGTLATCSLPQHGC